MIPICVPTLNRGHDRLQALLETALREDNDMQPSKIVILDNGNQFPDARDVSEYEDHDPELTKILVGTDKVITVSPGCNMGVAASWNWFLNNVPMDQGAMMISNDDVTFQKETLRMFYEKIKEPDVDFLLGEQNVWALYAITEKIFKDVGPFDENFYPAYFEDNDFAYRMTLKGYTVTQDENIPVGHQNSSTLAAYNEVETEQHHQNFRKNRTYYNDKWGGLPQQEKYITPFGK
jgi:GT2 family glycosyltransferase